MRPGLLGHLWLPLLLALHQLSARGGTLPECASCPDAWDPVCTTEGLTVANPCLAVCQGLSIATYGTACRGERQLPWSQAHLEAHKQHQQEQLWSKGAASARAVEGSSASSSANTFSVPSSVRPQSLPKFRGEGFVYLGRVPLKGAVDTPWDPTDPAYNLQATLRGRQNNTRATPQPTAPAWSMVRGMVLTVTGELYAERTTRRMSRFRPPTGSSRRLLSDLQRQWVDNSGSGSSSGGSGKFAGPGPSSADTQRTDLADMLLDPDEALSGSTAGSWDAASVESSATDSAAGKASRRQLRDAESIYAVESTLALPYNAIAFITFSAPGERLSCTGAFVSPYDVLTAAHCIFKLGENGKPGYMYTNWQVTPGKSSTGPGAFRQAIAAEEVRFYRSEYPEQDSDINYYDIALIRLAKPYTAWMGIKYDCSVVSYPKTETCGYPEGSDKQVCDACYLPTTQCMPLQQIYNWCYTRLGQSGSPVYDLADKKVLGVVSAGPDSDYSITYWTPIDQFHFNNIVRWIAQPSASPPPRRPPPASKPPPRRTPSPSKKGAVVAPRVGEQVVSIATTSPAQAAGSSGDGGKGVGSGSGGGNARGGPPPPKIKSPAPPPLAKPRNLRDATGQAGKGSREASTRLHERNGEVAARMLTTASTVTKCDHGSVRLQEGPNAWSGRVEVCNQGTWGTVCHDGWDWYDARVACKQLGYSEGTPIRGGWFPNASATVPSWLTNMACVGDEQRLIACGTTAAPDTPVVLAPSGCPHSKDAGIICSNPAVPSPPPAANFTDGSVAVYGASYACKNARDGTVRLQGGDGRGRGRVEICNKGFWGTICDDSWDHIDATVVCRQLNFTYGIAVNAVAQFGKPGGVDQRIWASDVRCTGSESQLAQCGLLAMSGAPACTHQEDAGVICFMGDPPPSTSTPTATYPCSKEGALRLTANSTSNLGSTITGRVEVCHAGTWGTVCDSRWTDVEAAVVCRQLGYPYSKALKGSNFTFTQPSLAPDVWMTGVDCTGSNPYWQPDFMQLVQCMFEGWGGKSCNPVTQTAGVVCSRSPLNRRTPNPSSDSCPSAGALRLKDGNDTAGRLEVCSGGTWGTVCTAGFNNVDAAVACMQMGYGGGSVVPFGTFPAAGQGQSSALSGVTCTGKEAQLVDCPADSPTKCTPGQDVGISCVIASAPTQPESCNAEGALRLMTQNVDTTPLGSGRVEVCHEQRWGPVCSADPISSTTALVVCRQLGYSRAAVVSDRSLYGTGSAVWLDNVICIGTENKLTSCWSLAWGLSTCRIPDVVQCSGWTGNTGGWSPGNTPASSPQPAPMLPTTRMPVPPVTSSPRPTPAVTPAPTPLPVLFPCSVEGELRVQGQNLVQPSGQRRLIGRLEVCIGGEWGSICSDTYLSEDDGNENGNGNGNWNGKGNDDTDWDYNLSVVACRQLGFNDAIRLSSWPIYPGDSRFPNAPSGMRSVLDDVRCKPDAPDSDAAITQCKYKAAKRGESLCGSSGIVGVMCYSRAINVGG